jgi:hypothetical protein
MMKKLSDKKKVGDTAELIESFLQHNELKILAGAGIFLGGLAMVRFNRKSPGS